MSERRETRETAYAHSGEGSPGSGWHDLAEHLRGVAARSRVAAGKWGGGNLGRVAGLWHDLGKYAPDWQEFLREVGEDAWVGVDADRISRLEIHAHDADLVILEDQLVDVRPHLERILRAGRSGEHSDEHGDEHGAAEDGCETNRVPLHGFLLE